VDWLSDTGANSLSYVQTQRRMQILADERRREAKANKTAAKRAPKTAEQKAAGKKFLASMQVDSAYDNERCADFQAWLNKEKKA